MRGLWLESIVRNRCIEPISRYPGVLELTKMPYEISLSRLKVSPRKLITLSGHLIFLYFCLFFDFAHPTAELPWSAAIVHTKVDIESEKKKQTEDSRRNSTNE